MLGDSRFDLILYSSVLHHIPDYLGHIDAAAAGHLKPGGSLVSIQDPLWYPRVPKTSRSLTEAFYLDLADRAGRPRPGSEDPRRGGSVPG